MMVMVMCVLTLTLVCFVRLQPGVQNAPFHRGEGKMMMMMMMMCVCVCVLALPVCFTRPHGRFLVLYRGTNHMAPPTARNWYLFIIYILLYYIYYI